MDEIEDFLTCSVGDEEYLQVVNGLKMPSTIIDWKYLLQYMTDKNIEYAKENELCETCHSPLKEYKSYEEVWGSKQLVEFEYRCPHGCD